MSDIYGVQPSIRECVQEDIFFQGHIWAGFYVHDIPSYLFARTWITQRYLGGHYMIHDSRDPLVQGMYEREIMNHLQECDRENEWVPSTMRHHLIQMDTSWEHNFEIFISELSKANSELKPFEGIYVLYRQSSTVERTAGDYRFMFGPYPSILEQWKKDSTHVMKEEK